MTDEMRDVLAGMAEAMKELALGLHQLAAMMPADGMGEAVEAMGEREEVWSAWDVEMGRWLIAAIRRKLQVCGGEKAIHWSEVDFSVGTLAEMVREEHETVNFSARRAGYVLRNVIGLELTRRSRFNGRWCVVYDEGVIEAWEERYGG